MSPLLQVQSLSQHMQIMGALWYSNVSECQGFIHPGIPLCINPITAPAIDAAYLLVEEKISVLETLVTGKSERKK